MRKQLFEQPSFLPEFNEYSLLSNKKIGMTGHQGVLGRILHSRLLKADLNPVTFPGDITDNETLQSWFAENHFEIFFHFAAVVPVTEVESDPLAAYETNVIATYKICKNLVLTSPDCWTFLASSSHVYAPMPGADVKSISPDSKKRPMNFYGISKLGGERIAKPVLDKFDIPYCIGRIFSFSHSSQHGKYLVPSLIEKINRLQPNEPLELVNPNSVRDIMDAESIIDAILHLAKTQYRGVLNIGSGKGRTVRQIADIVQKHLDTHHPYIEKTFGDPDALVADISHLKKMFLESAKM